MRILRTIISLAMLLLLICGCTATESVPTIPASDTPPLPVETSIPPTATETQVPTRTPLLPTATSTATHELLFSLEKSAQGFISPETFQAGLGDLDGDGDLDAVFANPMNNASEVWLNDGDGTLVNTGQQLTQYGHGVGVADFDGDGDLDAFIACHQFVTPSRIYLNDGSGNLQDTGQDLGDGRISAAEVNLLDLNGDGYIDVHVLYYDPNGLPDKVYLNDGAGTFADSGLALDEETQYRKTRYLVLRSTRTVVRVWSKLAVLTASQGHQDAGLWSSASNR